MPVGITERSYGTAILRAQFCVPRMQTIPRCSQLLVAMKPVRIVAIDKASASGNVQRHVFSGSLADHKCAVKTVSKSARPEGAGSHKAFAFVPPSAPVKVRHWPKI